MPIRKIRKIRSKGGMSEENRVLPSFDFLMDIIDYGKVLPRVHEEAMCLVLKLYPAWYNAFEGGDPDEEQIEKERILNEKYACRV